ncbi:Hypothetical predicted protein [Lecanosticta acicola]|uniref:Methyltransferase tdiE n=1 Tax=Lecanosticta acicola TaxID=111012 RepID=A0AAI9ED11_9PEZI|nr:Hypothetical predicted protein [Lecanosticta acicola]
MIPPNVQFEIDDWDDDWIYTQKFDLIHNRFNSTSVASWESLAQKSLTYLKEGGWVELADMTIPPESDDNSIPTNSKLREFFNLLVEGSNRVGRDLHAPKRWKSILADVGFVNIEERVFKVPVGEWPKDRRLKEAGAFEMETLREGLPAIGMGVFTRVLQWSPDAVEDFFKGVRAELDDKTIHFWIPMHVVWAQKPF